MISIGQQIENLENIKDNLEAALSLYNQNAEFYQKEIKALSNMLSDIDSELMDI